MYKYVAHRKHYPASQMIESIILLLFYARNLLTFLVTLSNICPLKREVVDTTIIINEHYVCFHRV